MSKGWCCVGGDGAFGVAFSLGVVSWIVACMGSSSDPTLVTAPSDDSTSITASTASSTTATPPSTGSDPLAALEPSKQQMMSQPLPDPRDFIAEYEVVALPDFGVVVKVGDRLDGPRGLGAVFSCAEPGGEERYMVVVSVVDGQPDTVAEAIRTYADAEECQPGDPGPPVKCMGLDTDPVSCGEDESG